VIDDVRGHTLVTASTVDAEIAGSSAGKSKTGKAEMVGSLLAKRAADKGIKQVAFDRNGCKYHGRVKALAEAAREGGLKF
jgi:large subunit ribosomal protein L18